MQASLSKALRRFNSQSLISRGSGRRFRAAASSVLETLETRQLLSAFVVNTLADTSDTPGSSTVSLRDAITAANNNFGADTITFDPSLTAGGPATITLSATLGTMTLSDTSGATTITGPGASLLTINGGNATQIFDINQGAETVAISGLTLSAGVSSSAGGALENDGTLSITACTISGNASTRNNGGAIYSDSGSTLTIDGSTISGNFSDDDGGAIYTLGTLTITNTTFTANHADDPGGAIYSDGPTLSISNSAFNQNNAESEGGAIYDVYGSTGTLTVNDSTFTGNIADDGGGAIYSEVGTVNITGGSFSNNVAEDDDDGGAIYNDSAGSMTINGTTFTSNNGTDEGGAIYNDSTSLTLTNCTFTTNLATYDGGAVYNDSTNLNISNSTFSGNVSEEDESGGALYNDCTTSIITGTTFTGNSSQDDGGAVYNDCSTSTFTNCTFSNNSAAFGGGGLYDDTSSETINGCTFSNNVVQSDDDGGAIFADSSNMTINNSTIDGNSVTEFGEGGGIYNDDVLTINNSTISNNTADYEGGGIYNAFTLTINNSTISGNISRYDYSGGGIFNDATATIIDSTISGNTAGYGGGIYNASSLTVANSTISANSASLYGGGVDNTSTFSIDNSIVAQNTASKGPDIDGAVASGTYNLIGDGSEMTGLTDGTTGNQVGTSAAPINAKLGALANNGGPTMTMALLSGSPAIDAGDPTVIYSATDNDQRGAGFPRVEGTQLDIGAFEMQLAHLVITAPATATTGTPFNVTVSAVDDHGNPVGGFSDAVHISSSDTAATLPADAALDSSTGVGTFAVTLNTAGNQTVTATDASNSSDTDTSGTIAVAQANRAPTDIGLSNNTIATGLPSGTTVGTLSTTDPDTGDTFTYTLVSSDGSTDNADFAISGNTLQTAAVLDAATQGTYSIRVRSTDAGGLFTEKSFTITVQPATANPVPSLAFVSPVTTTTVGKANSFLVHLLNADGSVNTTDKSKVTLSLVSGPGTMKGGKAIAAKKGAVKFAKVSFTAAGTYVIQVSDGTYTDATLTITVSAKTKKSLRLLLARGH